MVVKINGKGEELKDGSTVASTLLNKLNVRLETVAVELNGDFLDKSLYDKTELKDGDVIECLYYMGGGIHLT